MADTARTRAALLTLMADNVTGQISAQDFRDFMVTVMPAEFTYANDFWNRPLTAQLTAEGTRGWHIYSQVCDSAIVFGAIVYQTVSGTWKNADMADSTKNCKLAVAAAAIASDGSGILLMKGLVFKSAFSGLFSGYVGRHIFLDSGVIGSIAGPTSATTVGGANHSVKIIGVIEEATNGIFRFDADWSVVGV